MVDICLVPEVDFDVPALMAHARLLLAQKSHIVVSGRVLPTLNSAQHNTDGKVGHLQALHDTRLQHMAIG